MNEIKNDGMPRVFHLDKDTVVQAAQGYFNKSLGIGSAKGLDTLDQQMELARIKSQDSLNPKAVVASFHQFDVEGEMLVLSGRALQGKLFSWLKKEDVKTVHAYLLTAGEMPAEADDIALQIYTDVWATSFVDGMIDEVRAFVERELSSSDLGHLLSHGFGPGFYGLELSAAEELFHLLDGGAIGVSLRKEGCFTPAKTCAGLFLETEKDVVLPSADCAGCKGSSQGCRFCKNYEG